MTECGCTADCNSISKCDISEFIDKVSNVICAYCMANVGTYKEWEATFIQAGINNLQVLPLGFNPDRGGFIDMAQDEGLVRSFKIMINIMKNREIRNRVKVMGQLFKEYPEIFGNGIYFFRKF